VLIAGLTGGMACGKTFVADALRDLGAYVIEADALGHEVLEPSGEACAPVIREFGPGVAGESGGVDRAKLAAMVFGDQEALGKLTGIVHPAVRARVKRRVEEIAARDPKAVIVYVAAILLESGGVENMERLIVVTCTPEQQLERALERPGATEQSVRARLEHQMPAEEKAARADYVIDTSGTREATLRQTKMVFEDLRKLAS
jgi:dephospho-CoA kinase